MYLWECFNWFDGVLGCVTSLLVSVSISGKLYKNG